MIIDSSALIAIFFKEPEARLSPSTFAPPQCATFLRAHPPIDYPDRFVSREIP